MMLSTQQLDRIRTRAQQPAFAAAMQRLYADVAWTFERPLYLPERPAGYYHEFFCPDHAVQLEYDPVSPHRHRCPVDGAWFSGDPYDAAWLWSVNHDLTETAFRLALLWQIAGAAEHRDKARDILLGYAERYADFEHENGRPVKGKVTFSALDESVWIIPLAWATWFLRETLSAADLATIRERLLIPAAEHLRVNRLNRIHNIENWLNAAIGTIGIVTDRADLTEWALSGPVGFHNQVTQGILADGAWYEGSASYHFYSLAPLLWHARASEGTETDLRPVPQIRAMLSAPFQWAYPDLTLPAFNDCWYHSSLLDECGHGIPSSAGFYEVAAAWYDDPAYRAVLQRTYRERPRDTVEVLLYGLDPLPDDDMPVPASVHLPPSGYAVLRHWGADEDEQPYLLLKYGRHGGTHGHPDKLTMLLMLDDQRLSPDLGTPGYGIGLNDTWYRHTLSHNTVMLDQTAQPPGRGELRCFRAPEDGPFGIADATVAWGEPGLYGDARLRRVFLVGQGYFLDLFLVEREEAGDVDWVHHNRGVLTSSFASQPLAPGTEANEGYAHLTDASQWVGTAAATLTFAGDGAGLQLHFSDGPPTQVITADGPDNPASETMPVVIRRRSAQRTCFAALFHPYRSQPTVERVTWFPAEDPHAPPLACLVERVGTRDLWLLAADAETQLAELPPADHVFTYPVEADASWPGH